MEKCTRTQLQREWSDKTRSLWTVYSNVRGVCLLVEMSLNNPEVHSNGNQDCDFTTFSSLNLAQLLCATETTAKTAKLQFASISSKHIPLSTLTVSPSSHSEALALALTCSTLTDDVGSPITKKAVCPDEGCCLVIAICSTACQLCLGSFKCSPDLPSLCIPLLFFSFRSCAITQCSKSQESTIGRTHLKLTACPEHKS